MIGSKFTLTAVILAMLCIENSVAFQVSQPSCGNTRRLRRKGYFELRSDRRVFIETVSTITAVSILSINPNIALASGGATAGGAYLLSAKQRYNDRVKAGARSFVALGATIEGGDLDAFRSYFSQEDVGNWKDLSTAGYLLANAFRRNSTAAPDSLPSVKKWKAFAAQVESLTKALKAKNNAAAKSSYQAALVALDEYLTQVDLPPAKEL